MSVKINNVTFGSYAYKKNIKKDDILISINGFDIIDVLDYRFYQTNKEITLIIKDSDGTELTIFIKTGEYDEIGLEFETYLMDKHQSCKNKCVFCFIDQLPKGMRESLYFKDDDSRLSFLFGNYITLTNLTQHEIDRIIKMHISPINISVHTTNKDLRVKMMQNKNAGNVLEIIKKFTDNKIKINCQIVLCPNLNDGKELLKTLNDLTKHFPYIECIAVVPVGLTKFRENLYPLIEFNKETARKALLDIEKFGDKCILKYGKRIVYPADEFYIKAQRKLPKAEYYGDFEQLENGVGLLSLLRDEFEFYLEEFYYNTTLNYKVTIATGVDVAPFLKELFVQFNKVFENITVQIIPIENNFFGKSITVAGLVTGTDIIEQLKNVDIGKYLLIPRVMLRNEGDIFLDDISTEQLEKELKTKVVTVKNDGVDLINAVLGEN